MSAVKPLVRRSLDLVGLLPWAYRTRTWAAKQAESAVATLRSKVVPESAPDGLPVPPPQLRATVAGTTNLDWFLTSGRREANVIEDVLAEGGLRIDDLQTMLDFGCGCGRVLRYWHDLAGVDVHGTDYNPRLIKWCRANVGFASFGTNGIAPPLDVPDETYDFVYAISVLTHLPEELQRPWIEELARVTRRGGHVLLTTHGVLQAEAFLGGDELERFRRGDFVAIETAPGTTAGTNACSTFHPFDYVRRSVSDLFELVVARPGGPPTQSIIFTHDVYLLRRA